MKNKGRTTLIAASAAGLALAATLGTNAFASDGRLSGGAHYDWEKHVGGLGASSYAVRWEPTSGMVIGTTSYYNTQKVAHKVDMHMTLRKCDARGANCTNAMSNSRYRVPVAAGKRALNVTAVMGAPGSTYRNCVAVWSTSGYRITALCSDAVAVTKKAQL